MSASYCLYMTVLHLSIPTYIGCVDGVITLPIELRISNLTFGTWSVSSTLSSHHPSLSVRGMDVPWNMHVHFREQTRANTLVYVRTT